MKNGQSQHTTQQAKIDDFARSGITTAEGVVMSIGMILAVAVNPALGALTIALAVVAKRAADKYAYGAITDIGDGTRLQQVYIGDGVYFVSGQSGLAAIGAGILNKLVTGFERLIMASSGASRTNSVYFTRVDGTIDACVATSKAGPYTNLADLGFTFVVPLPVLGGFVAFRAKDSTDRARRIYFLSFDNARRGNWAAENWRASEPLSAMVQAILRMPLRLTAQNVDGVALTIQGKHGTGLLTVDLRELGTTGKITVVDERLFAETADRHPAIEVLGETDAADATVLTVGGETHFVPQRRFRLAITAAQAQL